MSQSVPMQPGIGFPPDSEVNLLRKLVWNTWLLAGAGGLTPSFVPVPASSTAAGTAGQMAYDDDYLYVAIGASVWRRIPLNDWS